MKHLVALGLLALLGTPERPLELEGIFFGGDPMLVYYEATAPLELQSVKIAGVPIKSWQFFAAFQKRSLEIKLVSKTGLNAEWDTLNVIDASGKSRALGQISDWLTAFVNQSRETRAYCTRLGSKLPKGTSEQPLCNTPYRSPRAER